MSRSASRKRREGYSQRRKDSRTRPRPAGELPALAQPYAATLQGETTTGDLGLLAGARLRHDRIRWWWGERKLDGWHGAYCYLCDRAIVTWDTRYPITREAQDAILAVRSWHLANGLKPHGIGAGAIVATADATPAGGQ